MSHKKYNETKEYGDWDDLKTTIDDIKAILDTNEKSNKKLKKLKMESVIYDVYSTQY